MTKLKFEGMTPKGIRVIIGENFNQLDFTQDCVKAFDRSCEFLKRQERREKEDAIQKQRP